MFLYISCTEQMFCHIDPPVYIHVYCILIYCILCMQTELRELNALREEFRNQRAHLDYQSDEEGDDFDD